MKNLNDKLTVLHTLDGSNFEDVSFEAFDFMRDEFTVAKTLYVGHSKPLSSFYVRTMDGYGDSWKWEYWNGATWSDLQVHDSTKHFTRDGFIQWIRKADEQTTTVNGKNLFWYKATCSTANPVNLYGIGGLFCGEEDIKAAYSHIDNPIFYTDEQNQTHIGALVSARDKILDELNVGVWQIWEHSEAKKACIALALSIIFNSTSDDPNDKWAILADDYYDKYEDTKPFLRLQIDRNNDNKITSDEIGSPRVKRWNF